MRPAKSQQVSNHRTHANRWVGPAHLSGRQRDPTGGCLRNRFRTLSPFDPVPGLRREWTLEGTNDGRSQVPFITQPIERLGHREGGNILDRYLLEPGASCAKGPVSLLWHVSCTALHGQLARVQCSRRKWRSSPIRRHRAQLQQHRQHFEPARKRSNDVENQHLSGPYTYGRPRAGAQ